MANVTFLAQTNLVTAVEPTMPLDTAVVLALPADAVGSAIILMITADNATDPAEAFNLNVNSVTYEGLSPTILEVIPTTMGDFPSVHILAVWHFPSNGAMSDSIRFNVQHTGPDDIRYRAVAAGFGGVYAVSDLQTGVGYDQDGSVQFSALGAQTDGSLLVHGAGVSAHWTGFVSGGIQGTTVINLNGDDDMTLTYAPDYSDVESDGTYPTGATVDVGLGGI